MNGILFNGRTGELIASGEPVIHLKLAWEFQETEHFEKNEDMIEYISYDESITLEEVKEELIEQIEDMWGLEKLQ